MEDKETNNTLDVFADAGSTTRGGGPSIEVVTEVDNKGRIHLILPSELDASVLRKSEKAVFVVCKADPIRFRMVEHLPDGKIGRTTTRYTKNLNLNLFIDLKRK